VLIHRLQHLHQGQVKAGSSGGLLPKVGQCSSKRLVLRLQPLTCLAAQVLQR
jgi:hypothetical protein